MSEIKIPDDQMQQIVSAAILSTVTEENRETLIKQAIASLLAPSTSSYDMGKSQLQSAFSRAVQQKAGSIINEMIAPGSQLYDKITELIKDATMKAFNDEARQKMVESIASSIGRAFDRD